MLDWTAAQGATIIYPGSHTNTNPVVVASENRGDSNALSDERLVERHAVRPAEQPCPRRGDIVIRDLRLWRKYHPCLL
jgi:hypothetical protein